MSHSRDNRDAETPRRRLADNTASEVRAFLRQYPEVLTDDPELIAELLPDGPHADDKVVDIRDVAVARLRARIAELESDRSDLIAATNANALARDQAHRASLAILDTRNFEHLIDYATRRDGLAAELGVAAVTLCVEGESAVSGIGARGVRVVERGGVDRLLQGEDPVRLATDVRGSRSLYGIPAANIRSEALVRLDISPAAPPGLLALGAQSPDFFHPDQASDLLRFLAGVLERAIRFRLDLPPPPMERV